MIRVVSLVPAATEIVAALGAEGALVGISHECDWPASVQRLPRVTSSPLDSASDSQAIDRQVRALRSAGRPVVAIAEDILRALAPDVIIGQDLCDVCAVADGELVELASVLERPPAMLTLTGRTLEGVLRDIEKVASAVDCPDEGTEMVYALRDRLRRLPQPRAEARPRVACIEWLDPVFLAGHWVPDLIAAAGGVDVGASAGNHSRVVELAELERLELDLLLIAPCGFGLDRAEAEWRAFERVVVERGERPPSAWGIPVWVLDGNAYTSRPGPRIVDGALRIAGALSGRALPGCRLVTGG